MSRAEADPSQPLAASRLGTLWTLWRASRQEQFGG
jgi:phytoene synthase